MKKLIIIFFILSNILFSGCMNQILKNNKSIGQETGTNSVEKVYTNNDKNELDNKTPKSIYVNEKNKNSIFEVPNQSGNMMGTTKIIKEYVGDIDNDGKKEKLIIGDDTVNINRILLYQIVENKEILIFDSKNNDIGDGLSSINIRKIPKNFYNYFDISALEETEKLFECADNNHNGFPEYYFQFDFTVPPYYACILEKHNDKINIIFSGKLDAFNFEDIDNDGMEELYGVVDLENGMYPPFGWCKIAAFDFKDGKYTFSPNKTKDYYNKHAEMLKKKIDAGDIKDENIISLLIDYAMLDKQREGKESIRKYIDVLFNSSKIRQSIEDSEKMQREQFEQTIVNSFEKQISSNNDWYMIQQSRSKPLKNTL